MTRLNFFFSEESIFKAVYIFFLESIKNCVFHRNRPVIPSEGGHVFQVIPITRSR